MIEKKLISKDVSDLPEAAKVLIESCRNKRIFAFYGEMGSGKTTFIKAICDEIGVVDTVNSPTFAIVNVYRTSKHEEVYHFDAYRMKTITEFYDIGYEDYFYSNNYCFIEWPEKIEQLLPEGSIKVYIVEHPFDKSRTISFTCS